MEVIGFTEGHDAFCLPCSEYLITPLKKPIFKGSLFLEPPRCNACQSIIEGTRKPVLLISSN